MRKTLRIAFARRKCQSLCQRNLAIQVVPTSPPCHRALQLAGTLVLLCLYTSLLGAEGQAILPLPPPPAVGAGTKSNVQVDPNDPIYLAMMAAASKPPPVSSAPESLPLPPAPRTAAGIRDAPPAGVADSLSNLLGDGSASRIIQCTKPSLLELCSRQFKCHPAAMVLMYPQVCRHLHHCRQQCTWARHARKQDWRYLAMRKKMRSRDGGWCLYSTARKNCEQFSLQRKTVRR